MNCAKIHQTMSLHEWSYWGLDPMSSEDLLLLDSTDDVKKFSSMLLIIIFLEASKNVGEMVA